MSGFGVPQKDIAIHPETDATTLRKRSRRELNRGTIKANLKAAQTLFQMATVDKNVAAIFRLKARAGWREKHPDKDDCPPVTTSRVVIVMDADGTRYPSVIPSPPKQLVRDIDPE